MVDARIKKLASIMVNYSIKVKKGDNIQVNCGVEAKDLALEACKLILKKGGNPILHIDLPGFAYTYYKNASMEQITKFPKIAMLEEENLQGHVYIRTDNNTQELGSISPAKLTSRQKALRPIFEHRLKIGNWVLCKFPTNALAQDAGMSLEEFEDFVYSSTNVDWKKESKKMEKLKNALDKGSKVRIVGEDTDISFSIKGRKSTIGDGRYNLPDGEVFIAPVENTTNGYIRYTFPAIYNGKEVSDVRLKFKNGQVVEAKASKNEALLKETINTDNGAKYLGEFGIGTNYGIKRFVKQILFDEKLGGSIHLALGNAYKEGGGKNESAIHWDMIKDLRKGGAVYIDGKLIQKNGKFLKL